MGPASMLKLLAIVFSLHEIGCWRFGAESKSMRSFTRSDMLVSSSIPRRSLVTKSMSSMDDDVNSNDQWDALRKNLENIIDYKNITSEPITNIGENDELIDKIDMIQTRAPKVELNELNAIKKMVNSYFEEGEKELLKSASKILSDGLTEWEDRSAENFQKAQEELLAGIDENIKEFLDKRKGMMEPFEPEKLPLEEVKANLELAFDDIKGLEMEITGQYADDEAIMPDSVVNHGPTTVLQKGTVLKEIIPTRADSGRIVVIGCEGPLGEALLSRLSRQQQASGLSMEDIRLRISSKDTASMLKLADTIIIAPDKDAGGSGRGLFRNDKDALMKDSDIDAVLDACAGGSLKHILCMSSIGVDRAGQFPFNMQNVGGKIDGARAMEQAIFRKSKMYGLDYTIVRVGKLCAESAGKLGVDLSPGDSFQGDTSRAAAEEAIVQSLIQPHARNATASVITIAGSNPPTQATWTDLFLKLKGPELLRIPLKDIFGKNEVDIATVSYFIREWVQLWTKPGSGLTTPVEIKASPRSAQSDRISILFKPTINTFVSSKDEKLAEKGGKVIARPGGNAAKEGGVEFVVEGTPTPRIRVVRVAMGEGVVLKEMSEELILSRFQKDIKALAV